MADIFYKIADGRIWDVQKAEWLNQDEAASLEAVQNVAIANNDMVMIYPDLNEDIENPVIIDDQVGIINLVSADEQSDVAYLAKTLAFYNFPLGELAIYSIKGIKEELDRLDEDYLTPRILAGLSTGDVYAMAQWQEHEVKAAPLRQRLKELGENDNQ